MDTFEGRIAVVTGGGMGMGRELVRQLARDGCHVTTCDVSSDALDETKALSLADGPPGTRVTTFVADVADVAQVRSFKDAVASDHATDHIHLLFNNAGIGGGGSMIADEAADWERTFGVDWGGVYNCTRTFLPMLMAAEEGHLVNTSSINGIWGTIGPTTAHTSYSAAKFAVRGFSEALIADFRVNAPHLRVSVVLPGHIGTSIVLNSAKAHGRGPDDLDAEDLRKLRIQLNDSGLPADAISDDDLRKGVQMLGEAFRDTAPTSAARAATIILDGVRENRWRILVGEDAEFVDAAVRADPEHAYDIEFWQMIRSKGLFGGFGS
jgi:NAD(P)-dependent dehydrogenase (short-subunit alcohol dehydrogenase family)